MKKYLVEFIIVLLLINIFSNVPIINQTIVTKDKNYDNNNDVIKTNIDGEKGKKSNKVKLLNESTLSKENEKIISSEKKIDVKNNNFDQKFDESKVKSPNGHINVKLANNSNDKINKIKQDKIQKDNSKVISRPQLVTSINSRTNISSKSNTSKSMGNKDEISKGGKKDSRVETIKEKTSLNKNLKKRQTLLLCPLGFYHFNGTCFSNCPTNLVADNYKMECVEEISFEINESNKSVPIYFKVFTKSSCLNSCGSEFKDCSCNHVCKQKGNCCSDYIENCQRIFSFPDCEIDEKCEKCTELSNTIDKSFRIVENNKNTSDVNKKEYKCFQCKHGYYLNLSTSKCVKSCDEIDKFEVNNDDEKNQKLNLQNVRNTLDNSVDKKDSSFRVNEVKSNKTQFLLFAKNNICYKKGNIKNCLEEESSLKRMEINKYSIFRINERILTPDKNKINQIICKKCLFGFFLINNTCVLQCPNGYRADKKEMRCVENSLFKLSSISKSLFWVFPSKSCNHYCGHKEIVGYDCSCEESCMRKGDCCADFQSMCTKELLLEKGRLCKFKAFNINTNRGFCGECADNAVLDFNNVYFSNSQNFVPKEFEPSDCICKKGFYHDLESDSCFADPNYIKSKTTDIFDGNYYDPTNNNIIENIPSSHLTFKKGNFKSDNEKNEIEVTKDNMDGKFRNKSKLFDKTNMKITPYYDAEHLKSYKSKDVVNYYGDENQNINKENEEENDLNANLNTTKKYVEPLNDAKVYKNMSNTQEANTIDENLIKIKGPDFNLIDSNSNPNINNQKEHNQNSHNIKKRIVRNVNSYNNISGSNFSFAKKSIQKSSNLPKNEVIIQNVKTSPFILKKNNSMNFRKNLNQEKSSIHQDKAKNHRTVDLNKNLSIKHHKSYPMNLGNDSEEIKLTKKVLGDINTIDNNKAIDEFPNDGQISVKQTETQSVSSLESTLTPTNDFEDFNDREINRSNNINTNKLVNSLKGVLNSNTTKTQIDREVDFGENDSGKKIENKINEKIKVFTNNLELTEKDLISPIIKNSNAETIQSNNLSQNNITIKDDKISLELKDKGNNFFKIPEDSLLANKINMATENLLKNIHFGKNDKITTINNFYLIDQSTALNDVKNPSIFHNEAKNSTIQFHQHHGENVNGSNNSNNDKNEDINKNHIDFKTIKIE